MTLTTLLLLRDLVNRVTLQVSSPDFALVAKGYVVAIEELDDAIEAAKRGDGLG